MTGSIPHQQIAVGKRKSYGPFWFANEKAEAVKCIWGASAHGIAPPGRNAARRAELLW